MSDCLTEKQRRRMMQSVRTKDTAPEQVAEALFNTLNVDFLKNEESLPGSPDFFFPDFEVAVFIHGCFWHGHQHCKKGQSRPKTNAGFWTAKIEETIRRDKRKARQLRKTGIAVYTLWECKLKKRRLPTRLIAKLSVR